MRRLTIRRVLAFLAVSGAIPLACGGGTTAIGPGGVDGGADVLGQDAPRPDAPVLVDAMTTRGDGGLCSPDLGPGVCGAALCGNGQRDTCPQCGGLGGGGGGGPFGADACASVTEACDGMDLGGQTCSALGYPGGALACTPGCSLDASVCSVCSPTTQGAGCTLGPQSRGVGLGASPTSIGLARVAHDGACEGVRLDRYDTNLALLGESACLSTCDAQAVAVAPTPAGWVLAVAVHAGLEIYALDAQGKATGAPRTIAGAYAPILTARGAGAPTGGPLLMWAAAPHGDGYVELLAADGTPEHPPAMAFTSTVEPHRGGAVFAGDAFLAAERASFGRDTIGIVRVGLDGSLGAAQTPAPGYAEYPEVAWTGTEGRLVYAQFSSAQDGMYWTRLDGTGAPLGTTAFVGAYPTTYARSPIVALGTDTLALVGDNGYLDTVHVSSAGVVSGRTNVTMHGVGEQQMVLAGSTAIAAWLESAGTGSFVQDAPGGLIGRAALAKVGP